MRCRVVVGYSFYTSAPAGCGTVGQPQLPSVMKRTVGVHDVGEGLRWSIAEDDVDAGRAEIVPARHPRQFPAA